MFFWTMVTIIQNYVNHIVKIQWGILQRMNAISVFLI